jgi:lauroyl/myristoyl acyltransferase
MASSAETDGGAGPPDPRVVLHPPDAHLLEVERGGPTELLRRLPAVHRAIPLGPAVRLAHIRAWLLWRLSPRHRRGALMRAGLLAHPGASRPQVRALARRHLRERTVQRTFAWHPRAPIPFVGLDHLESARAGPRGVIIATFHMGLMWNLLYALAPHGRPLYVSGGRRLDEPVLRGRRGRWLKTQNMWAERAGCRFVHRGGSYGVLRGLLQRGAVCWIGWDLPGTSPTSVQLLGRTLEVGGGLARLAVETGSPVIPAFAWREGNRPLGVLFPPIHPGEVDDARELDARVASAYETALAPRLEQAHFPPWRPDLAGIREWAGIRPGREERQAEPSAASSRPFS